MPRFLNMARMSSPTTGTGSTISLGSAVTGFNTFATAGAQNGDVLYLAIEEGNNREVGYYTYSSAGPSLTTRTVLSSTNGGSAISLSGSAQIFSTPVRQGLRELQTASIIFYVRTDGSDSNDGRANSSSRAFRTWNGAYQAIISALDFGGQDITIKAGQTGVTFTDGISIAAPWDGGGTLTFDGNTNAMTTTGITCFLNTAILPAPVTLKNFTFSTITSGSCVDHEGGGSVVLGSGLNFGACAGSHIFSEGAGSLVWNGGLATNYTISGGAQCHYQAFGTGCAISMFGMTVTLTGTPAFSSSFALSEDAGLILAFSQTFSGAATGTRYSATGNGVIDTFGSGANYFPGNGAGSTATGGQYI